MSSVTDMFVIVGDADREHAETIAPKVAAAIAEFEEGRLSRLPIISLMRDDWRALQGGSKVAGSAAIWFGWNFARPEELEDHLRQKGFTNITVWSHHENDANSGVPPRVVSW